MLQKPPTFIFISLNKHRSDGMLNKGVDIKAGDEQ